MVVVRLLVLLLFCTGLDPVADAVAADMLSIAVQRHKEIVTLSPKKASPHKVFTLPSPDRLVVDIPANGPRPDIGLPEDYKGRLIKNVRFGQFDPHTWRIVFDLSQPVQVHGDDDNDEITIELSAADKDEVQDEDKPEKKRAAAKPQAKARRGKPIIVIDPGHGGVDPGTEGPDGTYEKDVVLAYARELRSKLEKTGRYAVLLTRDEDDIIMLRKRVDIARKAGASLFISLHADSAPDEVRGLSVYTVSEKSSDQEAEQLAARENKADVLTGVNLADEREDVAGILISLAERETKNRSATFADLLVTALDDKVHLLSNSHRFAGFAVLKAPDVPSVLVEIGFLSHPKEEKLINSKSYRDKVTAGIAEGVDRYFRLENRMGEQ